MIGFDDARLERYSRHILLKDIGLAGQRKLWNAKVLIVGAGGLGAPVALYLAAAGVGTLGIADADAVDLSNLQRQVIHFTPHVGKPKVRQHHEFLAAENILDVIADCDFVIDGTDSFRAKFLINDACMIAGKPFFHGGILRFRGQTMTVLPGRSACYRCVFGAPPSAGTAHTCSQVGVLAAIQVAETLKFVTGVGAPLADALLTFDALDMNFRNVPLKRNLACPVCGAHPTILAPEDAPAEVCDLAGAHR